MVRRRVVWWLVRPMVGVALLAGTVTAAQGASPGGAAPPPDDREAATPVALVVFDFEVQQGMGPETGKRIADALSTDLGQIEGYRVIPRHTLRRELQKLGFANPLLTQQAEIVEAGHLLGAEIAVFGRAVTYRGALYLMAKAVRPDDLKVAGAVVKGKGDEDPCGLTGQAAQDLVALLEGRKDTFLGPLVAIRERRVKGIGAALEGLKLPRVAVILSESHLGRQLPQPISETELTALLVDAGLDAYSCGTPESRQWARAVLKQPAKELPPETEPAGLIIAGHAWSSPTEQYGTFGSLAVCNARVDAKIILRPFATEIGLFVGRGHCLDRSKDVAARKALERASQELMMYHATRRLREWGREQAATLEKRNAQD